MKKLEEIKNIAVIGVALNADGLTLSIPKGYIYFAMAFSVFVERLNLRIRKRGSAPLKLRNLHASKT